MIFKKYNLGTMNFTSETTDEIVSLLRDHYHPPNNYGKLRCTFLSLLRF